MGTKKGGEVEFDVVIWWIIGIAVLVLVGILFFYLKGKGISMLDYIRNLFRSI